MKKIITTNNSPSPIGAYNQAVLVGDMLFISGQIAIDPKNGDMVQDDIHEETKQVMENLQGILSEAGMTFNNIAKASIFLKNMDDFTKVDHIYGSYFDVSTAPAREAVQIARLPKNANVEISAIAYRQSKN
ncbi:RidA family protein [Flagellimonas marina]|uniref:RidA family protein n=1 Tax=Flagellimonas marina TaxID=1775168 RepID=A0ABV8PQS8_9FLAO